jgi:hypothetical protein
LIRDPLGLSWLSRLLHLAPEPWHGRIGSLLPGAVARVAWNEPAAIMKALDLGTCGIIVPRVNTADEGRQGGMRQ